VQELLELTSRVPSDEIPDILERLERRYPAQDVSVVLATNMLSVGVDIPRLGLMVVNGQPKSMAEYIQATSRVGRGAVPGLILTVYSAGRARDRAHYESFRTWHQALYRDVEATSVTPFAPRARDKALHAAIVALARHLVTELRNDPPTLTAAFRGQLENVVRSLEERARSVEEAEADATASEAAEFLDLWESRGPLQRYWDDYRPRNSLLVSAEHAAARAASSGGWTGPARPTPNTMREVEPSVRLRLVERLSDRNGGTAP
jgi:superfamily II DNA or RNA helicase